MESSKTIKFNKIWQSVQSQYTLLEKLGEGSFGQVYKAQSLQTGEIVAIKLVINFSNDAYRARQLLRELILLRKLTEMKQNSFTTGLKGIIIP